MELKKQGNFVFALISSLNTSEVKQFKRFLNFEFTKPEPYLKIVSFIEKQKDFDYEKEVFPEDLLLKNCGPDIEKKYSKLKHQLKHSLERFIAYLTVKEEQNNEIKYLTYFQVKSIIVYKSLIRLQLLKDLDVKMEALAIEAKENGYFDLSSHFYSTTIHNVNYSHKNKNESIKRTKELQESIIQVEKNQSMRSRIRFYNTIFFNSFNHLESIKKDIADFEKIDIRNLKPQVKISYYATNSNLTAIRQDYQSWYETNLEIINLVKNNKDLPLIYNHYKFSSRFNAFQAALLLGKKDVSFNLLEEVDTLINDTDKLFHTTLKEKGYDLLKSKLLFILKFEKNKDIIISKINEIECAIENKTVILNLFQKSQLENALLILHYITEENSKSYDIGYKNIANNKLSVHSFICFLLVQYHQFDIDFLESSFRNILRTNLDNLSYSKVEVNGIKTIMSNLKKLKTAQGHKQKIVQEICDEINNFEDKFLQLEKRIVFTFSKSFKQL